MSLLTEDRRCFRHRKLNNRPAGAEAEVAEVAEAAEAAAEVYPGNDHPWE
jgi:hypothetical protein